jgi:hypothetical protein
MVTNQFAFARSLQSSFRLHSVSNTGAAPVLQYHAPLQVATSAPAPAIEEHASNSTPAPVLLIHQAPVIEDHATHSVASAAPAPAVEKHIASPAPALLIHQPPVLENHATNLAANSGQTQILKLAPIVHPAPAAHTQIAKAVPSTAAAAPVTIASIEPIHATVQPGQVQTLNSIATVATPPAPVATNAQAEPPAAPANAALPSASLTTGLEGSFKPLTFYSEGDATVVSYDASDDTITTDDGRTFVIGATVTASHAISWQDYRANVHYRCDQNGNCSLMRTGVVALNARLL